MELRKLIYSTVHRREISVEEISDQVGCSASLLYRVSNPNDDARFPLEKLLPLMRVTKDYSILQHLARRSGFLVYRLPSKLKPDRIADLNELQVRWIDVFKAILGFRNKKTKKSEALTEIDAFLSTMMELRNAIKNSGQMEIEFLGDD